MARSLRDQVAQYKAAHTDVLRAEAVHVATITELEEHLEIRKQQLIAAQETEGRLGNAIETLREQLDAQRTIRALLRRLPVQKRGPTRRHRA